MQFRVILIAIAKMKVDGKGRGLILTQDELKRLFTEGFFTERDRLRRTFTPSRSVGICLLTGCRVSEALALQTTEIKSGAITFRKSTSKGKHKTPIVDIPPGLAVILADYSSKLGAMFSGT